MWRHYSIARIHHDQCRNKLNTILKTLTTVCAKKSLSLTCTFLHINLLKFNREVKFSWLVEQNLFPRLRGSESYETQMTVVTGSTLRLLGGFASRSTSLARCSSRAFCLCNCSASLCCSRSLRCCSRSSSSHFTLACFAATCSQWQYTIVLFIIKRHTSVLLEMHGQMW